MNLLIFLNRTLVEYIRKLFLRTLLLIKNHILATTLFFRGLRMRKAKWCMWTMCQEDLRAVVCVLAVMRKLRVSEVRRLTLKYNNR